MHVNMSLLLLIGLDILYRLYKLPTMFSHIIKKYGIDSFIKPPILILNILQLEKPI